MIALAAFASTWLRHKLRTSAGTDTGRKSVLPVFRAVSRRRAGSEGRPVHSWVLGCRPAAGEHEQSYSASASSAHLPIVRLLRQSGRVALMVLNNNGRQTREKANDCWIRALYVVCYVGEGPRGSIGVHHGRRQGLESVFSSCEQRVQDERNWRLAMCSGRKESGFGSQCVQNPSYKPGSPTVSGPVKKRTMSQTARPSQTVSADRHRGSQPPFLFCRQELGRLPGFCRPRALKGVFE